MQKYLSYLLALLLLGLFSCQQEIKNDKEVEVKEIKKKPEKEAKVFFENLKDGEVVNSPFKVQMGVKGMVVDPAGKIKEGSGHHHILINETFMKEGEVIPMDDTHKHFGKGQTITELSLEPGNYTLTLQFANGAHMSYGEKLSTSIKIEVK